MLYLCAVDVFNVFEFVNVFIVVCSFGGGKKGVSGVLELSFACGLYAERKAKPSGGSRPQDGYRFHEFLECRLRHMGPARPTPGSGPAHEDIFL